MQRWMYRKKFDLMAKLKARLKEKLNMSVTNQTVESLLCEYRKWVRNTACGTANRRLNRHTGSLVEYKAQYTVAMRALAVWNQ